MNNMTAPLDHEVMQSIINRLMGLPHDALIELSMDLAANLTNQMFKDITEDQFGYATMRVIDLSITNLTHQPPAQLRVAR